jgi:hypothetical protein
MGAVWVGVFSLPALYVQNQKLVDDKVCRAREKRFVVFIIGRLSSGQRLRRGAGGAGDVGKGQDR